MTDQPVLLNVDNQIAEITLNRPEKHNAFNDAIIEQLSETTEALNERADVSSVILRGKGESFSAGADLNWMEEAADAPEEENRKDAIRLAEMLQKLFTMKKVTIACVQGVAMGGGLGLVSCCDVVIAEEQTTFGFSEVSLGLIPATIAPYVLKAIGQRQARRYFQTGELFSGERAREIGLVHELVGGRDEMDRRLSEILDTLKKNGPQAMSEAKSLCLDFADGPITRDVIEETAERIAQKRTSEEGQEGVRAFLEDRDPEWTS